MNTHCDTGKFESAEKVNLKSPTSPPTMAV